MRIPHCISYFYIHSDSIHVMFVMLIPYLFVTSIYFFAFIPVFGDVCFVCISVATRELLLVKNGLENLPQLTVGTVKSFLALYTHGNKYQRLHLTVPHSLNRKIHKSSFPYICITIFLIRKFEHA